MPEESLAQQIEAFIAWDTEPDAAIPIVRRVDTPQLGEFYREARVRMDVMVKQWAQHRDNVPHWIGAAHPLAPWELRRKVEILEMEWRARHD